MNIWNGTGRLVKDPEMKTTENGKKFINFTIAVPKQYNKNQADFVDCQVWNKSAEYLLKFGKKGMRIEISGAITTNINGENKYTTVISNTIDLIFENTSSNNENNDDKKEEVKEEVSKDDMPF
jgi:single-strand DNA-binding protein